MDTQYLNGSWDSDGNTLHRTTDTWQATTSCPHLISSERKLRIDYLFAYMRYNYGLKEQLFFMFILSIRFIRIVNMAFFGPYPFPTSSMSPP